jgi:hypothetical protein
MSLYYYLSVNTNRLSIELDSDIHYHEHFKEGDVLTIQLNANKPMLVGLNGKKLKIYPFDFKLDWDSTKSKIISITEAIRFGLVSDITKSFERNEKLKKIGI